MIKNPLLGQSIWKPDAGFISRLSEKNYVKISDVMFCLTELKKIWKYRILNKIIFLLFEAFLVLLEE